MFKAILLAITLAFTAAPAAVNKAPAVPTPPAGAVPQQQLTPLVQLSRFSRGLAEALSEKTGMDCTEAGTFFNLTNKEPLAILQFNCEGHRSALVLMWVGRKWHVMPGWFYEAKGRI